MQESGRAHVDSWTAGDILILLAGKNRRSVVNIGDAKTACPPHLALYAKVSFLSISNNYYYQPIIN